MRYPKFLKENKTISLIAPSFALQNPIYIPRFEEAKRNLEQRGFKFKYTDSIFAKDDESLLFGKSFESKANDFINAYLDTETDLVWSVAGGELMVNILEYIDFNKISKSESKWYVGYSDNTNLCFLLTTICDIASIYCYNFTNFGVSEYEKSMENLITILNGNIIEQDMFTHCESEHFHDEEHITTPLILNQETCWKSLSGNDIKMEGRIIGGCLDCLVGLAGTKYDKVNEFERKYKKEGTILFFESCDLNIISQLRAYTQLENCGWFDNINGIIIGRPLNKENYFDATYEQVLHQAFDHLGIPVIYDFDTGHIAPMITIINGSYVEIELQNKKGSFKTLLK